MSNEINTPMMRSRLGGDINVSRLRIATIFKLEREDVSPRLVVIAIFERKCNYKVSASRDAGGLIGKCEII